MRKRRKKDGENNLENGRIREKRNLKIVEEEKRHTHKKKTEEEMKEEIAR